MEMRDQVVLTYDQAIQRTGGFGKFQIMSTLILTALFNIGGQIIYGLTFMTVRPNYECLDPLNQDAKNSTS